MIELLSLATALMYTLSHIAVRKGLAFGSNAVTAANVSLFTTFFVFLTLLLIFVPMHRWSVAALPFFCAAGILAPGLFRYFLYSAIARVGIAIASVATNVYPLVAVVVSMIFLGEQLTPLTALGIALILGAIFLAAPRGENQRFDLKTLSNRGFLLALTGAIVRGASETLRKSGLIVLDSPIFGAATANASGFTFSLLLLAGSRSTRNSLQYEKMSMIYFVVSSLFQVAAWILGFYALSYGDVVRVAPIVGTVPIFTVLLSTVLLRGVEKITPKIILASIFVAAGVTLIRLGA
ncbi:MAG: EamA family transporter [Deltaproteobacteria bacterium]|nr:EamA family transporter [Deltaproteobacteria bacterium]